MKIALFHYHLRPGGVTDFIIQSTRALLCNIHEIEEIWIVSGDHENAEHTVSLITEGLPPELFDKIHLDVLKEISYLADLPEVPDPKRLANRLEARYDSQTIFWVHNYHLGKNVSFTKAIMILAQRECRKLLLQIHDLPECGRPYNLEELDTALDELPYPSGSHIRYAVINSRDQNILNESGLSDSVFLLNNPMELSVPSDVDPSAVKSALEKHSPNQIPDAPTLLYPVRAIRRKNILEAALLARLFEKEANLVITLPGTSDQEKNYSALIARAYEDSLISGSWLPSTFNEPVLTYPNLCSSCDAFISTSIQEGFGYLFVNALHWRKPLLARYLEIVDGFLHFLGDYPRRLWADLRVPLDKATIETIQEKYRYKINQYCQRFPSAAAVISEATASKLISGNTMDISYLDATDQIEVLKKARNDLAWLEEARSINRELIDSISRTLQASAPAMDEQIESEFGPASFARNFGELVKSFGKPTKKTSPERIRKGIMKKFSRLDYLRLLYDQL